MSITKPFTFVAGTKARANEVNQNFDVLYSQVNSNISAINANANDIDTLDSNKANVNGSSSQRFACADPTSQSDAVNKQSLTKAIGNSINYIDGYVISKDSGSPNDTILVTAGSCYDYTKSVVLAKDTSTTKQNTSQGASTTYYVYVIGNDSGSSVDILISSSAVTPALPEGYTKFRQIGSYTTDSSRNISYIYYYGNESNGNKSPISVMLSIAPNYSRATSVLNSSGGGSFYISWDGWLEFDLYCRQNSAAFQFYIDGVMVGATASDEGDRAAGIVMVKNGSVASWNGSQSITIKKIPILGG